FIANEPGKLKQVSEKTRTELIWAHFLSVLQFWKNDRSPGFEKTDMYIEKSIELGFEIINTAILGKFFDLGKFLWSEKV
ncbi:TetR/AcrR family transcriptional regulator, partial [Klebsiella pneumoniae]